MDDEDKPGSKENRKEIRKESAEHPRIAGAIKEIDQAVAELRKASHDFGGHREEAIKACEEAVKQLRLALESRAEKDEHSKDHPKK